MKIIESDNNNMSMSVEDGKIVILFIPDKKKPEHFHIELDSAQCNKMAGFLNYDKIQKRINELKEALELNTGNEQFDAGFNLAVHCELEFYNNR